MDGMNPNLFKTAESISVFFYDFYKAAFFIGHIIFRTSNTVKPFFMVSGLYRMPVFIIMFPEADYDY